MKRGEFLEKIRKATAPIYHISNWAVGAKYETVFVKDSGGLLEKIADHYFDVSHLCRIAEYSLEGGKKEDELSTAEMKPIEVRLDIIRRKVLAIKSLASKGSMADEEVIGFPNKRSKSSVVFSQIALQAISTNLNLEKLEEGLRDARGSE